jgi:hypothetical protein
LAARLPTPLFARLRGRRKRTSAARSAVSFPIA